MSWRSLTTSGGLDTGGSGCSYATFPHFEHRERWGTRQDIITADDRPIETLAALTAATYLHNPDKPVKLEILRGTDAKNNKEKKILYVAAVEKHDQMDLLMDATDPEKSLVSRLGILVVDITDAIRSAIGTVRIPGESS
jgi:hypothetical protein